MSNTFNPEIIVHNGEGLTLTLVPNERVFETTKDNIDYEFKFKDSDVNNNNEVTWKNHEKGIMEIRDECFRNIKKPIIIYPLDGTTGWSGDIEFEYPYRPDEINSVILEISGENNFKSKLKIMTLNKNNTKETLDFKELKDFFGSNFIYLRVKIILNSTIYSYSSVVKTKLSDITISIDGISDGDVIASPLMISFLCPDSIQKTCDLKVTISNNNGYTNEINCGFVNEVEMDVYEISKAAGFSSEISVKASISYKSGSEVVSDILNLRTLQTTIFNAFADLVNYLNNNGDPRLVDLGTITDLSYLTCLLTAKAREKLIDGIHLWDVSRVTNLSYTFSNYTNGGSPRGMENKMHKEPYDYKVLNKYDLSNWDTSSVTNMCGTFRNCYSLIDLKIGNWNTSNVTDMSYMFAAAHATRIAETIDNWNVSKVTNMQGMFYDGSLKHTLRNWDTSSVTDMSYMFYSAVGPTGAVDFLLLEIENWNTSSVTNMSYMFSEAELPFLFNINNWDVSKVTNMSGMFSSTMKNMNSNMSFSNWDTSSVRDMSNMFNNCPSFNCPLNSWNVSKVTNMQGMFAGASSFNQPLNNWNVSNVESSNMSSMFSNAARFNQNISMWNVTKATTFSPELVQSGLHIQLMRSTFENCPISYSNKPPAFRNI